MRKLDVIKLRKNKKSQKPRKESDTKKALNECSKRESECIEFLKIHKKPWNVIEAKWEETHKIRMSDIKNSETKLEFITTKYPLITNMDLGPLLVRK